MPRRAQNPPHQHDCIRIVPVHAPQNVLRPATPALTIAAATAHLTYRNGPLLQAVEVFTVFWGSAWTTAPHRGLVERLNAFFDVILTSELMDQLSEYSTPTLTIGHGRRTGSATIPTGAPTTSVTDAAIQAFLTQQIANGTLPEANANTLYILYLPPDLRVVMGGAASCQAFCGYHSAIGGETYYAVMPYPGCTACLGGETTFDALTSTSSHELCEAVTDPIPGAGWYDDTNGELGDVCAWQTKKIGNFVVQLEWSNKAKRCV